MTRTVIHGKTKSGKHIYAELLGGFDKIYVDGQQATITGYRHFRDGGTRIYITDKGQLLLPHKIGSPDHHPRWNGEDIGEPSQEILEWREREQERITKVFKGVLAAESNWWRGR